MRGLIRKGGVAESYRPLLEDRLASILAAVAFDRGSVGDRSGADLSSRPLSTDRIRRNTLSSPIRKDVLSFHRLIFASELRYPVFPQLNEMLFTAMMMYSGDVAAQLVQTLATLLVAAILIAWGLRAKAPLAGWLAAALWLGNPLVLYLSTSAYVECGLALFFTAALWASERWRETDETRWLMLAAAFAGFAAATKYTGLVAVALILMLTLRRPIREALPALGGAILVALVVMLPWYGRLFWLTGNPLFPFMPKVFGDNLWVLKPPSLLATFDHLRPVPPSWPASILRIVAAPIIVTWTLVTNRQSLGDLPPVSAIYLLSFPMLALAPFWRPRTIPLVAVVVLWLGALLVALPPSSHYLVMIFPIWSLVVGYGCSGAAQIVCARIPTYQSPVLIGLVLLFLLPGRVYIDYRRAKLGVIPTTSLERETYLSTQLPVYRALSSLNQLRRNNYIVYALFAENMSYFAEGRYLGDWNGLASFARVLGGIRDACDLADRLRGLGAGYLLVPTAHLAFVPQDRCFARCFTLVFADFGAELFALEPRCQP